MEQDLHITSPSPAPPVSGVTPCTDLADFLTIPLIRSPPATYEALRTIRVILSEAIYRQIITSCKGYVAVAALTGVMNVTLGCSISLGEVLGILCKFGSQYVEVIRPEGLWLVKDKSPSTVPNWFTFRPQSQVPIVHPPGAVARVPRQSQGLRSIIDHGQVTRSDVLRMALKYMLSAEVVIPVHGDWVEFHAFMGNLGTLEGFATDPVLAAMEITCGSHLIMKRHHWYCLPT